MTQLNITLDFEKLKEDIMGSNLNDVLKSMVVLVLNKYMEMERDHYMQNSSHERNPEREDYRNGYYERDYVLNIGKIKLKVPRTRSGNFSTDVFQKFKRNDQALVLSMMEMVVNGISTRKVTKVVEQLCGETVSKSMVSELTKELDPLVKEWAERPLNKQYYRYLYVDAMYIKVREYHRVVSKAVYVAMAVNTENKREIIGFQIANKESTENWKDFFTALLNRGLQSPKLIISDAHEGLKAAIAEKFLGSTWQRCTVHFLRNMMDHMPKKASEEPRQHLKEIFRAATAEISRKLKDEFIEKYEGDKRLEKVIRTLDEGYEDAVQFYMEPKNTHKHIRTTNVLERLNSEIRRREKVIRIFPHQESAFRLIGAVLQSLDEELDPGNKRFIYERNE